MKNHFREYQLYFQPHTLLLSSLHEACAMSPQTCTIFKHRNKITFFWNTGQYHKHHYKIHLADWYFVAAVCEIKLRFLTPKKMNCHYGFVVCTRKVCFTKCLSKGSRVLHYLKEGITLKLSSYHSVFFFLSSFHFCVRWFRFSSVLLTFCHLSEQLRGQQSCEAIAEKNATAGRALFHCLTMLAFSS